MKFDDCIFIVNKKKIDDVNYFSLGRHKPGKYEDDPDLNITITKKVDVEEIYHTYKIEKIEHEMGTTVFYLNEKSTY